jgi:hypothetical protein
LGHITNSLPPKLPFRARGPRNLMKIT